MSPQPVGLEGACSAEFQERQDVNPAELTSGKTESAPGPDHSPDDDRRSRFVERDRNRGKFPGALIRLQDHEAIIDTEPADHRRPIGTSGDDLALQLP